MIEYLNYCKASYFTNVIPPFVALVICLYFRKKNSDLAIFKFYLIINIVDFFLNSMHIIFFHKTHLSWQSLMFLKCETLMLAFIEFFVFKTYFEIIAPKSSQRLGRLISFLYVLFALIILVKHRSFFTSSNFAVDDRIFTLQSSALVALCVIYYYDVFRNLAFESLANEPSFWIFTGLFFCMLCTLPLNILFPYLRKNYPSYSQIFSIVNVFYVLLFAMIGKAFLCSPTLK
jgi:hypothetical protein